MSIFITLLLSISLSVVPHWWVVRCGVVWCGVVWCGVVSAVCKIIFASCGQTEFLFPRRIGWLRSTQNWKLLIFFTQHFILAVRRTDSLARFDAVAFTGFLVQTRQLCRLLYYQWDGKSGWPNRWYCGWVGCTTDGAKGMGERGGGGGVDLTFSILHHTMCIKSNLRTGSAFLSPTLPLSLLLFLYHSHSPFLLHFYTHIPFQSLILPCACTHARAHSHPPYTHTHIHCLMLFDSNSFSMSLNWHTHTHGHMFTLAHTHTLELVLKHTRTYTCSHAQTHTLTHFARKVFKALEENLTRALASSQLRWPSMYSLASNLSVLSVTCGTVFILSKSKRNIKCVFLLLSTVNSEAKLVFITAVTAVLRYFCLSQRPCFQLTLVYVFWFLIVCWSLSCS